LTGVPSHGSPALGKTDDLIDVSFDFRSDTPRGKDPDIFSRTLRLYHRVLWSKPLPNGQVFSLVDTTPGTYLHHSSQLGEFFLASDSVIPTFRKEARLSRILEQIPKELTAFVRMSYTIGGMMLFPGNRVGGKMTLNGARGCHPRIKDRFDLTVECIRRHYRNAESPLSAALTRYADFFRLFGDFQGYVEFFLLQDLITEDCSAVKFFLPFDDFRSSPLPNSLESYSSYKRQAVEFIQARNRKIVESTIAGLER